MSKSYKVKRKKEEEEIIVNEDGLSKKELYDLNKKKKETEKIKDNKVKEKKRKKRELPANLGTKLFAIFMLVLMIASVLVSALAYFFY